MVANLGSRRISLALAALMMTGALIAPALADEPVRGAEVIVPAVSYTHLTLPTKA